MNLPKYRCHKIVEAAAITQVAPDILLLHVGTGDYRSAVVTPGMFSRYTPVPGDYFVLYEDGYQSISPKAAFEAGYTRIEE